MVSPMRREGGEKNWSEISAPSLNRLKTEPKCHPMAQQCIGNWLNRFLLSVCLLLTLCLVNGLIMVETKAYNWQKSQASAKEIQIRQLQTDIAQRLSELVKNSPKHSPLPILLSVNETKTTLTLLGRR